MALPRASQTSAKPEPGTAAVPTNVTECIQQVEEVEPGKSRNAAESDERESSHQSPRDKKAAGAKAVDQPTGDKAKYRADDQLA